MFYEAHKCEEGEEIIKVAWIAYIWQIFNTWAELEAQE